MRNPEQTVGNMADKLKTAFIGSVDEQGFPNVKAMLQPRKREGIKVFYFTTNNPRCVCVNISQTTKPVYIS